MKKKKVLFVCWGNVHRSPLAEEFLRRKISQENLSDKIKVVSCGLQGYKNNPKPKFKNFSLYPEYKESARYFKAIGIDFSVKTFLPISREFVNSADLIIVMDQKVIEDKQYGLINNFPDIENKTTLFSEICGINIEDPYRSKEKNIYIKTSRIIESGINKGFKKILKRLEII